MPAEKRFGEDWVSLLLPGLAAAEAGAMLMRQMAEAFAPPRPAPEPDWASPNEVVLELRSARLRRFGAGEGRPLIVCAPFSVHGAQIADLCAGHSLMQVLLGVGAPLYLVEWLSADADQGGRRIDDYLADLNVLFDELGFADFIGLCQGGWLGLIYAARFPAKVGRLVLAGAPVDIGAGVSALSRMALSTPMAAFRELVAMGGGLARGAQAAGLWRPLPEASESIRLLLQSAEPADSPAFLASVEAFRRWSARTLDVPGAYYLEVAENFYKNNALARGAFVALGKTLELRTVRNPLFLLTARDDEVAAPAQSLACADLVGTPACDIGGRMAEGGHVSLYFGAKTLRDDWPEVVDWLAAR